jgi:2-oxoglutarate ferredoxin oxidoreductase subunit beta
LAQTLEAAARHKGVSFVEILQDCVVFNEGVLSSLGERSERDNNWVFLEHGRPVRFGKNGEKGIVLRGTETEVVTIGSSGVREEDLMVHDTGNPSRVAAYLLASFNPPERPMAFGIFRQVQKPTYDDLLIQQIDEVVAERGHGDLPRLLRSGTTWLVD